MSFLRRRAWITLLALVVLLAPLTALAQDAAVRIDGSRIVADLVAPLSDAYAEEAGVDISLEISGTNSGLARLCNGEIDIANAARPITSDEAALCADNDVEWVEVLLGYDALAVIANPTFARTECLPFSDLSALMGPSATETIINLQTISPIYDNIDFVLYAPASDTTTYNLLDELLPGDGLRSDLNTQESVDELITLVADDVAGLGVAPLSAVLASDAAVNTIALDDLSGAGCIPASEETLTDGTYPGARGLFLYVNAASLENEAVTGLMDALLNADAQATVAEMGFSPLGDDVLSAMQTNVADSVTGRTVSEGEPLYSIPLDVEGTVLVDTAATAFGAAESVTNQFSGAYSTAAVNLTGFGNSATYRKLCAGESDLGFVTRAATGDELAACEDNGVALWEAPLGNQAVVMVVPEAAEYATCLTTDQITTLWQAEDNAPVTNWSELGADFPDQDITVFLPRDNETLTDYILANASGSLLHPRTDALEANNDPLYRAAATANVEGAITYMTYAEYLKADAAVLLVEVDAGDGCVAPSMTSIADGSYALANPVTLVATQPALARPEVQGLVWFTLREASADLLSAENVLPVGEAVLAASQEAVITEFDAAEIAAEEAAAAAAAEEEAADDAAEDAAEDEADSEPEEDAADDEAESEEAPAEEDADAEAEDAPAEEDADAESEDEAGSDN